MPTSFPASLLKPGMYLYEDVYFQGAILLPRGTEVAERHLRQMKAWGVEEICVLGDMDDFSRIARDPGAPAPGAVRPAAASAPAAEGPPVAALPPGRWEGDRYVVTGSLGPAPGRTEVAGDLVVEGAVSGQYEVAAGGSIEIRGEVTGGRIVARGGDVRVGGPVRARAPLSIEGRDVRLGEAEGAEVLARRRIEAALLSHCRVRAEEEVVVTEGVSTIRGGAAAAGLRIVCGTAGTREGTPTDLAIPRNPERIRYLRSQSIEREIAARRAEYARLEKVIRIIRTLGDKVATLSPEKREELAHQSKRYLALQGEMKRLESDLSLARAEAESDAVTMDRCPISCGLVYPGVRISIGDHAIPIGAKAERVGYYFRNGRVLVYVSTRA